MILPVREVASPLVVNKDLFSRAADAPCQARDSAVSSSGNFPSASASVRNHLSSSDGGKGSFGYFRGVQHRRSSGTTAVQRNYLIVARVWPKAQPRATSHKSCFMRWLLPSSITARSG